MLVHAVAKQAARQADIPHKTSPSQHHTGLLLRTTRNASESAASVRRSQLRRQRDRGLVVSSWGTSGPGVHLKLGHVRRREDEAKLAERMSIRDTCPSEQIFYVLFDSQHNIIMFDV